MGRRNRAALGALLVGAIAAGALLSSVLRGTPAHASPAVRIIITDPDGDDQFEGKVKLRANGDGTLRFVVEADVMPAIAGEQYAIRVEVTEVSSGEKAEAVTPNLTAQPPR